MDKLRPYIEQALALAAGRRADARAEAAALQALAERQHLGRRDKREAGGMQAAGPVQDGDAGKAGTPAYVRAICVATVMRGSRLFTCMGSIDGAMTVGMALARSLWWTHVRTAPALLLPWPRT